MTEELQRAVGRIEGKLEQFMEQQRQHNEESATGRRRIYARLEEADRALHELKIKVDAMGPTVAEAGTLKQRFIGAWLILGGVATSALALFWSKVTGAVAKLFGP